MGRRLLGALLAAVLVVTPVAACDRTQAARPPLPKRPPESFDAAAKRVFGERALRSDVVTGTGQASVYLPDAALDMGEAFAMLAVEQALEPTATRVRVGFRYDVRDGGYLEYAFEWNPGQVPTNDGSIRLDPGEMHVYHGDGRERSEARFWKAWWSSSVSVGMLEGWTVERVREVAEGRREPPELGALQSLGAPDEPDEAGRRTLAAMRAAAIQAFGAEAESVRGRWMGGTPVVTVEATSVPKGAGYAVLLAAVGSGPGTRRAAVDIRTPRPGGNVQQVALVWDNFAAEVRRSWSAYPASVRHPVTESRVVNVAYGMDEGALRRAAAGRDEPVTEPLRNYAETTTAEGLLVAVRLPAKVGRGSDPLLAEIILGNPTQNPVTLGTGGGLLVVAEQEFKGGRRKWLTLPKPAPMPDELTLAPGERLTREVRIDLPDSAYLYVYGAFGDGRPLTPPIQVTRYL